MTELPDSLTAWAQARLTEVEIKLAFAEDLIDALNQTVISQQAQLDSMQQQLRLLHRRIEDVTPDETRNLRDEIPPHY
ncbi:MAG: SlyX protein [Hydrogenophilales bacterium 17-62-8]|nr:MAG: SlyX protein [Hydrogenophilales bacterium 17-62-8]